MSASASYAILVAVGPDPKELERVGDLIDSIRAYEPGPAHLVLVDDGEDDRKLASHFDVPTNWKLTSVAHPRREFPELSARAKRGKGICAAILQGLAMVAREAPEARFTLKLDTDALVISPFVQKLSRVVEEHPNVGMIGAYDHTPSGAARDISKNASTVREMHQPGSIVRRLRNWVGGDGLARISRHIGAARRNAYRYGEHCLGGAYAVSRKLVLRMQKDGYLDKPKLWLPIDCPEDVMVGIYTKAVGCDYLSYVDRDEVFGVRHRGLDDAPRGLLERGYSVIHAVKNDPNLSEAEIRAFFREQRQRRGQQS
jgi:hypothetical protein